ncbi:histidinol-phosphatase [Maribellus luteus]|uniref:Histidinol-phosphatase n=1 Tax=Maribellus luteus TaxID=2305463 RepID=A0A399T1G3_9BACT|nr:Sb-PDE family phosphodiesterase [Maribellus luteus]RIJ48864.1 histidinol-phosphatase [Maribellus luteus]
MCRKKFWILLLLVIGIGLAHGQSRRIINIPDISGYKTLKCDFHIHTVFSDGTVWPTVRINEAWEEGLDAISITDHIEYRPHSTDVVADHNRSYEIAVPLARQKNILLVKGAEITRSMPPGHLNALFIKNANLLDRDDVFDAIKEARDQGAFLIWNHPGWKAQQPDSTLWWPEHSNLLANGLLHGIEVYNSNEYYPEALEWANEKKLTMFANTDVHGPMNVEEGQHRPMTLVFAKSRTEGGIKEALFNRRTLAYFDNTLVGQSALLEPVFFASLEYDKAPLRIANGINKVVYLRNNSDLDYELELVQPGVGFDAPERLTLKAHHVTPLSLSGNSDEIGSTREINLYYTVKNMFTGPVDNLIVTFTFKNLP